MFGGLISRFLFMASHETRDLARTTPPRDVEAQWIANEVQNRLDAWRAVDGDRILFQFDPEAANRYDEWYVSTRQKLRALPDSRQASLADRVLVYAKKIAMVYAVLEESPTACPLLSLPQVEVALVVADFAYESLMWATRGWCGPRSATQERHAEIENKITRAVREAKDRQMWLRRLLRRTGLGSAEVLPVLNSMKTAGLLDMTPHPKKRVLISWIG